MSLGGILAAGIAGGAKAYGDQLTKDIAQQQEADLFKTKSDIMEQAELRKIEAQERARRGTMQFSVSEPMIKGEATKAGAIARAQGEADVAKAAALAAETRKQTIADAANPTLLAAIKTTALANPLVAAEIAQRTAAAGASGAEAQLRMQQLADLSRAAKVDITVKGIQDDLSKTKDPARRAELNQKLTDLTGGAKDVNKAITGINAAQDNAAAALKQLADPLLSPELRPKVERQLEEARQLARMITSSFNLKPEEEAIDPAAKIKAGIAEARKAGKIRDAVAELRAKKFTDDQILAAGVTKDEVKAIDPGMMSDPIRLSKAIANMDDDQFVAYKKLKDNQPLSPMDRILLKQVGITPQ